MKKAYVKPQMFYENFELSHHIAACGMQVEKNGTEIVPYDTGIFTVFTDAGTGCPTTLADLEEYCNETSSEDFSFFAS